MKSFSIGVDLGGTNMRVAAVDETGHRLETIFGETAVERGPGPVVDEMCAGIQNLKEKFAASHSFAGVGIGVPGTVDIETGVIRKAVNLPGWDQYPVKEEIQRRLEGKPVTLENDANCAALGEKWLGAGRDVDHLCMLTLGTGIGGSFIFNGAIWHGMMGMAGEIGHITVSPDGPACGCGNRGCLELFASAKAITQMAKAVAPEKAPDLARAMTANPEAKTVFQCAAQGNPAAQQIFATVGWALGVVLSGLVNVLNLPLYVIGGGVSSAWKVFEPALFHELRSRSIVFHDSDPEANPVPIKKTLVQQALLGSDAGLLGAARLPWLSRHKSRQKFNKL